MPSRAPLMIWPLPPTEKRHLLTVADEQYVAISAGLVQVLASTPGGDR